MADQFLYQRVAESIRQQISQGKLSSGDRLPSVREMATHWNCTIGTIQRAYEALGHQGLVVSRPGQGTRVAEAVQPQETTPLRRAMLVHRAEAFLLEVLTAGYTQLEVEQAVRLALDRWRALSQLPVKPTEPRLRFVGSHDPAIALIVTYLAGIAPNYVPQLTFAGSLKGLIALASGEADLAGCHLWDEESDTYNSPFVRRLLPGRRVALLTLAHRQLGFITAPANRTCLTGLTDLTRPDLRFVNRQSGAGTRVWLDAQLYRLGLAAETINGYGQEMRTHSEVAHLIAEGKADVGLGVEAAATAYGLEFIPLTKERYDLVIPAEIWADPAIQNLVQWLATDEAKKRIASLGGYDLAETGRVEWIG